jgi:ribosomal protein S18 acetylase RimI-like enzyme
MDVQVRQAEPGDVDTAVPLIYASGAHEWDYGFATRRHPATEWIRVAFLGGSATESYRGYRVALVDGRVVGVGSFLPSAAFDTRNALRFVWESMRTYGPRECWGVMRRTLRLMELMPSPGKDALFIQRVGVSPELRGNGIGGALLDDQIRAARAAGLRRAVLDVAVTNPRAQALYERLGFRVTGERELKVMGPVHVPLQRRMELDL